MQFPKGRTIAKAIASVTLVYIASLAIVLAVNLVLKATVPQLAPELGYELIYGPAITIASFAVLFGIVYWIVGLFGY